MKTPESGTSWKPSCTGSMESSWVWEPTSVGRSTIYSIGKLSFAYGSFCYQNVLIHKLCKSRYRKCKFLDLEVWVSVFVQNSSIESMSLISLCRFIYETEHHNGIAELLEILGRWAWPLSVLPWQIWREVFLSFAELKEPVRHMTDLMFFPQHN